MEVHAVPATAANQRRPAGASRRRGREEKMPCGRALGPTAGLVDDAAGSLVRSFGASGSRWWFRGGKRACVGAGGWLSSSSSHPVPAPAAVAAVPCVVSYEWSCVSVRLSENHPSPGRRRHRLSSSLNFRIPPPPPPPARPPSTTTAIPSIVPPCTLTTPPEDSCCIHFPFSMCAPRQQRKSEADVVEP